MPMPKRREEPLLRGGLDLEMGYVGDQEAIPAYNSAVPWQAGMPQLHAIWCALVDHLLSVAASGHLGGTCHLYTC